MRLGVLVNNLSASQLNYYLIRNGNAAVESRAVEDLVVFYENAARPCLPMNFATMQAAEAWSFDGTVVATTLSTAARLARFPGPRSKFFYVWDLEWLRGGPHRYRDLRAVYCHPELRLLARSEEHRRVLASAWREPAGTVEDFRLDQLPRP